MLYPVQLSATRPLSGSYGWPPGVNATRLVMPGENFTTDNKTAEKLEARGLAQRAEQAPAQVIQPSDEVAAMIRSLKAKMARPIEAAVVESPENKMLPQAENKTVLSDVTAILKRGRGRPKGSKNRSKEE